MAVSQVCRLQDESHVALYHCDLDLHLPSQTQNIFIFYILIFSLLLDRCFPKKKKKLSEIVLTWLSPSSRHDTESP